jgi:hypothetical protein
MLTFNRIQGDVQVHERDVTGKEKGSFRPTPGTNMPLAGKNLLITTGVDGNATLSVNGQPVELRPNSYLRVKPDGRSFIDKHTEILGKKFRLFIGRVWAEAEKKAGTAEREEVGSNAAIGIRG